MTTLIIPDERDGTCKRNAGDPTAVAANSAGRLRGISHTFAWFLNWFGPYRGVVWILLGLLAIFSSLRIAMLISFADWRMLSLVDALWVLLTGLKFDLLVGLCLILFQTVHLTFISERRRMRPISRFWLEFGWLLSGLFLPLVCVVEWLFFDEFQSRLNYIAFEYLVYPTEVCCNIWQSYSLIPLISVVVAIGGSVYFLVRRPFLRFAEASMSWSRRCVVMSGALATIAGLWHADGMDDMQVSSDRVANECAGNGLFSFVYYAWTCRFDYDEYYLTMDQTEADAVVRQQVIGDGDERHLDSPNPVDRTVVTHRERHDYNVVLILEESLGSDFIGVLGGDTLGLTPHFDKLSRDGLLFTNFYATGNRTARALEAVLTSMPPLPIESILKRDHSQRVYTLAHVLESRGYERLFVTGGRGLFDGVRSFMTANGFNRFVEQSDIANPVFTNAWGVSDEDLFRRGLQELNDLHATGRPFFATLLTVSNHRPYTYPADRIPQSGQTRENAVRYADWAIGEFFRQARHHAFYDRTIFVVMGDHGARIYGSQLFPLRSYRVPMLLILPDGESRGIRNSTLACSLDVAPTIMEALGGEYRSVFFGRNIRQTPKSAGRALMQHNHDVALLSCDNCLTVLGFGKSAWNFLLERPSFDLRQLREFNPERLRQTIALFQTTHQLYYHDLWFPNPRLSNRRLPNQN